MENDSVTFTVTAKRTVTPTVTVTPTRVVRKTITTTATDVLPQVTDTFSVTLTNTATATSLITSVIPSVVTASVTVTTTDTITVSTSSGFLPFASNPAVIAAGGGTPPAKRGVERPQFANRGLDLFKRGLDKCRTKSKQYPSEVTCYIFKVRVVRIVITVTAHKTQTRTARPVTSTSTITAAATVTVTPPDASVTLTITTVNTVTVTDTILTTSVSTSTSTSTVTAPTTATYYPQCQSNNVIEFVGGTPLYYLSPISPFIITNAPDPLTCCQLCANTANCGGYAGASVPYTDCYLFTPGTCDATATTFTVYNAAGQTGDFSVVGNGNCGQGAYGGNL